MSFNPIVSSGTSFKIENSNNVKSLNMRRQRLSNLSETSKYNELKLLEIDQRISYLALKTLSSDVDFAIRGRIVKDIFLKEKIDLENLKKALHVVNTCPVAKDRLRLFMFFQEKLSPLLSTHYQGLSMICGSDWQQTEQKGYLYTMMSMVSYEE